jgi:hypothetical protein
MGMFLTKLFDGLFGKKEVRILILGLDNAAKTTILCKQDKLAFHCCFPELLHRFAYAQSGSKSMSQ